MKGKLFFLKIRFNLCSSRILDVVFVGFRLIRRFDIDFVKEVFSL